MTSLSNTNTTIVQTAANVATALFAFFIGVQLLVATDILPVSILWGGRQTELTPSLRVASMGAAIILGVFIYIIRYRAGLVGAMSIPVWVRVSAWGVTAYIALNTLGNFASISNTEKLLFGPLTLLITIACLIVAASSADHG